VRPVEALRALANQLEARGGERLCGAADSRLGVLSVAYGVTVWTDGETLWWLTAETETLWPATDPDGAARLLLGQET
jgi:hypothetical protein